MTQHVFDNAMTAHVWAQQEQDSGRSSNGNLYFEGRSIFSYGSHFVAGYVAPGPLYLINSDSYSISTGCHIGYINSALDYGRGKFSNSGSVPGLGAISNVFYRMSTSYGPSKAEARKKLTGILEYNRDSWPGQTMAARLYIATGMNPAKAEAKALAGERRVHRATMKAKAAKELADLNREAGCAKVIAAYPPAHTAQNVRDLLTQSAEAEGWNQERYFEEAQEESRDCFRAAKAAKAKGWGRISATVRAHYKAARVELKRFETSRELFAQRGKVRAAIATIRQIPERLQIAGDMSRYSRGADTPSLETKESRLRAMGARYEKIRAALITVAVSPYAKATNGIPWQDRLANESANVRELKEQAESKAEAILQERQQCARAAWRDTGERPPHGMGRLADSEGGALLRVEGLERDDSGAITGGTLVTSWAATVPLVAAIKAFKFLKLCRVKGRPWAANGHTLKVGHFRIESIDAKGNFRAACHRINWQEVFKIALSLGLAEIAIDDSALEPRGAA